MLARLMLALLIALLPMPAAAAPACHTPAPAAETASHHHVPAKQEPVKQLPHEQLCIGCVAPATARAPQLAAPLSYPRADAPPAVLSGIARAALPPATPPPRFEA